MTTSTKSKKDKIIAFGYYGGKFSHLNWLLPLLPKAKCYVEPFGGSMAVLLNREQSPIEVYNDLDGELVNFFRQLRENHTELERLLSLTPYSREEFQKSIKYANDTPMERARKFFVRIKMCFFSVPNATPGRWGFVKSHSRNNMSLVVSNWWNSIPELQKIAERIMPIQIEHDDAINVIARYDSDETFFYIDPPYAAESRKTKSDYLYEMSEEKHRTLAAKLLSIKGKFAISCYKCDLVEELYGHLYRNDEVEKVCHVMDKKRQESLWMNYNPSEITGQSTFWE